MSETDSYTGIAKYLANGDEDAFRENIVALRNVANEVCKQVQKQELMKEIMEEGSQSLHTNIDVKQQTKKQNDDALIEDANKILKLLLGEE